MNARPVLAPPSALPGAPTDKETCQYIAEMCAELRHLAKRPRFRTINYLLVRPVRRAAPGMDQGRRDTRCPS